jgi:hypothetical protein
MVAIDATILLLLLRPESAVPLDAGRPVDHAPARVDFLIRNWRTWETGSRQIVAIARVNQASTIYSDDRDIRSIAALADIRVVGLADLQVPPEASQHELPLARSSEWSATRRGHAHKRKRTRVGAGPFPYTGL